MSFKKYTTLFYGLSAICMTVAAVCWFSGKISITGWALSLSFVCIALAFRGSPVLKGMSFTAFIFASVALAMFHPGYFLQWGDFKLSGAIIPLIQVLMFGMGSSMGWKDFAAIARSPKGVLIGVLSQFTIMPFLGYALAGVSGLEPEIAAGIILIGCSPSGLASNVMAYLAKANLALSVTITSITTLIAPLVTPLLMRLLAGALVEIDDHPNRGGALIQQAFKRKDTMARRCDALYLHVQYRRHRYHHHCCGKRPSPEDRRFADRAGAGAQCVRVFTGLLERKAVQDARKRLPHHRNRSGNAECRTGIGHREGNG